jgi:hypothetical protein
MSCCCVELLLRLESADWQRMVDRNARWRMCCCCGDLFLEAGSFVEPCEVRVVVWPWASCSRECKRWISSSRYALRIWWRGCFEEPGVR